MNGFLQEYGLNIVAVIIVLAFIVFASVFGDTITGGINDITSDFFAKSGVTADVNGSDDADGNDGVTDGSSDGNSGSGDSNGQDVSATLISFTIDGISYQAEEGMKWCEWLNSIYNTDGFHYSQTFASNIANSNDTGILCYKKGKLNVPILVDPSSYDNCTCTTIDESLSYCIDIQ